MLFESKSIVGIEIDSLQIRFVWMDSSTKPAKVLDFGVVNLLSTHPENVAQQLMAVVKKRGLEGQKASLAVSDSAIVHHTITTPPLSSRDMQMAVKRETKKAIVLPLDKVIYDWKVLRDIDVTEGRKREVLIVVAPSITISTQKLLLKQSGLKPLVLTTIPLTLLNALTFMEEGNKTTAFVHLGETEGYILFARNGLWCFSRNFPLGTKDKESNGMSEIHRSILYFNLHFHGEGVERVILSGKVEELRLLIENWKEMYGAEDIDLNFNKFDPSHNLDLTPLGGRAKEFREIAVRMVIPLGLARGTPKDLLTNLLSVHNNEKGSQLIRKRMLILLIAVFFLFTIGGYVELLQRTNYYSQILHEKRASLQKFQPLLQEAEEVQKQRSLYQRRLEFLQQFTVKKNIWVKVLQELSWLVPEEVVLKSLKLEHIEGKVRANIKGEATASDQAIALSALNCFRSGLKGSALFANIEYLLPQINQFRQSADSSFPGSEEGRIKVNFEIKCDIRE